jgi:flagellar biosynthesis GTPase FlhF
MIVILLAISLYGRSVDEMYNNGKNIYMEKCVSCHGINGDKMTPWKFHNRGYERFEDIVTHSKFIHNDISRKIEPKVLKEYGLSSNQLNIKLNHLEGIDLTYYLKEEFSSKSPIINWLIYIGIIIVVLIGFRIYRNKLDYDKRFKEAQAMGFRSIEEHEKDKALQKRKAEANAAGFDSIEEYNEHLRRKKRERLEAEAKRNGFNSAEEHQQYKNEQRRKEQEEKQKRAEAQKEKQRKEREEQENAPRVIIKAQFRPATKDVIVTTKKGDKTKTKTIGGVLELKNWTSHTITIRHLHNPKLIVTFNADAQQIDQYIEI